MPHARRRRSPSVGSSRWRLARTNEQPEQGNTLFSRDGAMGAAPEGYYLVSKRREYAAPQTFTREIQLVERVDGAPVLAIAIEADHDDGCAVETVVGASGIAVTIVPSRGLAWAWVGTSTWDHPSTRSPGCGRAPPAWPA